MNDETKLLMLQLLETTEKVFDHFRPRTLPPEANAEFHREQGILKRIEAIKERIHGKIYSETDEEVQVTDVIKPIEIVPPKSDPDAPPLSLWDVSVRVRIQSLIRSGVQPLDVKETRYIFKAVSHTYAGAIESFLKRIANEGSAMAFVVGIDIKSVRWCSWVHSAGKTES